MWYRESEKFEINRLVEKSHLPARKTFDPRGVLSEPSIAASRGRFASHNW